ncbi:aspartate/glutamate racemase family protein [Variovorax sp. KK3]|uniref:aspartate/glutamate racemase family protein n=1 Tax=Variovorax sp. KK3 TaxID=1855728 RepID=UPI00097BF249|nr:aspartate/glutamate racemase family protein [Variovorax sp. KK3]
MKAPESRAFVIRASFDNGATAIAFLEHGYIPGLEAQAAAFVAKHGKAPRDQDFPEEVIRLRPARPTRPPLLIIGGMGPLAGARAMIEAIGTFDDTREIVLLQLCKTPDRSEALEADGKNAARSERHERIVQHIASALVEAEGLLETTPPGRFAHLVVACNTAHHFVPDAFQRYADLRADGALLQLASLVDCTTRALSRLRSASQVVVLGTTGTLSTRLYLGPLEAAGVGCVVPGTHAHPSSEDSDEAPSAQQALTNAIYRGVKAFDDKASVRHGEAVFRKMVEAGQIESGVPFVVLAACTEVRDIIDKLLTQGSPEVRLLLAHARIVEPISVTFEHVKRADAADTVDTAKPSSKTATTPSLRPLHACSA